MLFEMLLIGGGYLLGKVFGGNKSAKAAAATYEPALASAPVASTPADFTLDDEVLFDITIKGTFVNNDGWTYGVQHRYKADGGHFFKMWLINPVPFEHERHLTFEGAQEHRLEDVDAKEVFLDVLEALRNRKDISAKYHGFRLDDVRLSVRYVTMSAASFAFPAVPARAIIDADGLEIKDNCLLCLDGGCGGHIAYDYRGEVVERVCLEE